MNELDNVLALAQNSYEREEYLKEIEFLEQALKLTTNKKDTASIYEKLGTSFYLLERTKEAKENYFLASEILSGLPEDENKEAIWAVNNHLGAVFYDEGEYEKALIYRLKAFEYIEYFQSKDAFMLLTAIGVNYDELEAYDKAIDFYHKALEVSVDSDDEKAVDLQLLGRCYDKKGEDRKAFRYYHELFSIDPDYDGGWYLTYRFAQLSYRFRNYEDSKKYLQEVITQIPSDQNRYIQSTHLLLGYNYIVKKEYNRALDEFNEALKIKMDFSERMADIYCGIAQAYFGLNKVGKAIKFGLKSLNKEYDEIVEERIYFLLAFCYGMRGIHKNKEKEGYYTEKLKSNFPNSAYLRELRLWGRPLHL